MCHTATCLPSASNYHLSPIVRAQKQALAKLIILQHHINLLVCWTLNTIQEKKEQPQINQLWDICYTIWHNIVRTLTRLWHNFEITLTYPWLKDSELRPLWHNFDTSLIKLWYNFEKLWHNFDSTLAQLWHNFGTTFRQRGDNFYRTLGQFWDNFRTLWQLQWLLAERTSTLWLWSAYGHFCQMAFKRSCPV